MCGFMMMMMICMKNFVGFLQIGHLKKGLNPPSVSDLAFGSPHLAAAIKTGIIIGVIGLAVSNLIVTFCH